MWNFTFPGARRLWYSASRTPQSRMCRNSIPPKMRPAALTALSHYFSSLFLPFGRVTKAAILYIRSTIPSVPWRLSSISTLRKWSAPKAYSGKDTSNGSWLRNGGRRAMNKRQERFKRRGRSKPFRYRYLGVSFGKMGWMGSVSSMLPSLSAPAGSNQARSNRRRRTRHGR